MTHANVVAAIANADYTVEIIPGSRYLAYLPLAHILELVVEFSIILKGLFNILAPLRLPPQPQPPLLTFLFCVDAVFEKNQAARSIMLTPEHCQAREHTLRALWNFISRL